jgi:outer membrane protein assembly factor BamB
VFFLQRAISKPNLFNVLALEKSTGKIIWETENTHPYYCFDEVNNKLYGLGHKQFEVISTVTGKKALIAQLDVNVFISSHLTFYSDGFLYFSSQLDNNIPVFGAVNVKSGKLEFIQEVKIEGEKSFRIGLEKPIVVENRLYIKDSLNTLHIFSVV